jgi:hypothetical protein
VLKALVVSDDEIQRQLAELTGRHKCIGCLAEVEREEYFANDFMCVPCAEKAEHYPLATTPSVPEPVKATAEEIPPQAGSEAQR